ncbi:MAG TPA: 1,4-beta-xylanase, partial [Terriglobales bacterium]
MRRFKLLVVLLVFSASFVPLRAHSQRWSEAKANAWYQQQPWLVGSNFTPADAINQLEMWQAATFDPQE